MINISKFLLDENFKENKRLFVESKYFNLYDTLLNESIDDEISNSIDEYVIEKNYYFLIDIDLMLQSAVEYDLYNAMYDFDSYTTYDMFEIKDTVLNEILRLYKVLFIDDVSILIRMLNSLDNISNSLYEILNDN